MHLEKGPHSRVERGSLEVGRGDRREMGVQEGRRDSVKKLGWRGSKIQ